MIVSVGSSEPQVEVLWRVMRVTGLFAGFDGEFEGHFLRVRHRKAGR